MYKDKSIILASKSPRRQELLNLWGIRYEGHPAHAEEPDLEPDEDLGDYVNRLAKIKAEAVAEEFPDRIVLGADTIVAIGMEILGKPSGDDQAKAFLRKLSGTRHQVWTGTALVHKNKGWSFVRADVTHVLFRDLSDDEIDRYVNTGEPHDKAGAYAIQGGASEFVIGIEGAMDTVIGLPKEVVLAGLEEFAEHS